MKIEIKHRYTDEVLYTCEDAVDMRDAVEKAAALKVNLSEANLDGANLYEARLDGANLDRANLGGASLGGASLKAILQTGPIGSRNSYAICFNTDKGLIVKSGCFNDTMEKFKEAVEKSHGDNKHGRNYRAWINLCEEWAKE